MIILRIRPVRVRVRVQARVSVGVPTVLNHCIQDEDTLS